MEDVDEPPVVGRVLAHALAARPPCRAARSRARGAGRWRAAACARARAARARGTACSRSRRRRRQRLSSASAGGPRRGDDHAHVVPPLVGAQVGRARSPSRCATSPSSNDEIGCVGLDHAANSSRASATVDDGITLLAQQPRERAGNDGIALGDDDTRAFRRCGTVARSPEELTQVRPTRCCRRSARRPSGRFRAAATFPSSSAATVIAPLGSTTSFSRSSSRRIAPRKRRVVDRDDVVEVTLRGARRSRADLHGEQPVGEAAGVLESHRPPAARARVSFGAPVGSTPITRAFGSVSLIAVATPALNPPPPTGTSTVSTFGRSAAISSPTVPWPAMIRGWSYGGTSVSPFFRDQLLARVRGDRPSSFPRARRARRAARRRRASPR